MNENEQTRNCPRCGAVLAADAPEGLCPRCLMALNLGAPTEEFGPGGTRIESPPRSEPPPLAEIARLFPQFEILEFAGRGGMGFVYKARQPKLDRLVALKVLVPEAGKGAHFPERFQREAQALAKLNHPNIVAVHDFGEAGGFYYLAMEFVEGVNLRELIAAQKLKAEEALAIVPPICDALQYAHGRGIVHRDIKPENILIDKQGRVKIADFGIAKILGTEGQVTLTGEQQAIGTPHYMAPEQIEHPAKVDHRADIYSLGVVFYEMLTGELPLGKFQPPSAKVQVDVRLDEVVLRSLAKEPTLRYQQASEVKTRVEAISQTATAPGAPPAGSPLAQDILTRDYRLDIGHCVSRGWNLVWSNFWPLVGVYALTFVLKNLAGLPSFHRSEDQTLVYIGTIFSVILAGPLSGGLYLYFLKIMRGEHPNVEIAFAGFSNRFLPLFLGNFVALVLSVMGLICLIAPGIYLFVAWQFTLVLIMDRGLDFWTAMELSRKVVTKHWWKFFGFGLVLLLFKLAGLVCLVGGFFIAAPIAVAAFLYAYEDIFGKAPATVPSAPPVSQPASSGLLKVMVGLFVVIMLVFVFGLLGAIAIPNFVKARERAQHLAAQQLSVEGWQLFQEGKFADAQKKFKRAVEINPNGPNALNGLGWTYFDTGERGEAEINFQKALSLDTNIPGALNGLGQIYLEEKEYNNAEEYFKKASSSSAAWYGLVKVYLLEGKFDEARPWAQKLVDSGQADDTARQMLKAAEEKRLSNGLRQVIEPR